VEEHLKEHVAEFLAHLGFVARLNCVDELGGLLDEVFHKRAVRLRFEPGAATVAAKSLHRRDQLLHGLTRHALKASYP
jgi:hypothetical protein